MSFTRERPKLTNRYKNDPQIVAMTSLVSAYQARDVKEAEKILKGERCRPLVDGTDFLSQQGHDHCRPIHSLFH